MAFLDFIPLIGSAVNGIASLFGQSKGNQSAIKAVQEQNAGNMALAEYGYQKDLEMWQRQNEYNLPVNQIQRLKDAGLNPNLAYGMGNVGNANSSPNYSAPSMQAYTDFGDFGASRAGQALMNGLVGLSQVKKTNAETDYIRQNTQNLEVEQTYKELRNDFQMFLNAKTKEEAAIWKDILYSRLQNIDSNTMKNYSSAELNDSNRFLVDDRREMFNILRPIVIDKAKADLSQALFSLNYLSPAKLNSILLDNSFKEITTKIADLQSKKLDIELNYHNSNELAKNFANQNKAQITQLQRQLLEVLQKYGVKPDGTVSNVVSGILYNLINSYHNN